MPTTEHGADSQPEQFNIEMPIEKRLRVIIDAENIVKLLKLQLWFAKNVTGGHLPTQGQAILLAISSFHDLILKVEDGDAGNDQSVSG